MIIFCCLDSKFTALVEITAIKIIKIVKLATKLEKNSRYNLVFMDERFKQITSMLLLFSFQIAMTFIFNWVCME